jgi:gamma-glutamyltranspeptidase/glutathione hydrolase
MSLPDAVAALRLSQRNGATTQSEPGFEQTPEYAPLVARGQKFAVTETPPSSKQIGAATGIEFLPDGQVLAAAEPTRRGGGSAAVVGRSHGGWPRGHGGRPHVRPPHDVKTPGARR